jgi:hypothetical protein
MIITLSSLLFCFGLGLFIPGWLKFWDQPTTTPNILSVNLCPSQSNNLQLNSETQQDDKLYQYFGASGPCTDNTIPSNQEFRLDASYLDGGDFPIVLNAYVSKYTQGSFSFSLIRGNIPLVLEKTLSLDDDSPTSNFGIVGGANTTILRSSPWNLSGRTNGDDCQVYPGCLYYPLFTTYLAFNLMEFTIPSLQTPSYDKLVVRVNSVNLTFNSTLDNDIMIDFMLQFQNEPSHDQTIGMYMALAGALLMDISPGIAYYLWFSNDNRKREWKKQIDASSQSQIDASSQPTQEDTLDEKAAEQLQTK